MVIARRGVLLECSDPAIKQIILDLDNRRARDHEPRFILEDLDSTHLFVDEALVDEIKVHLEAILEENTYRVIDKE